MTSSPIEHGATLAQAVHLTTATLTVDLTDGRSIAVPLAWYPRLAHATPAELENRRFIGRGEGIHWPDLDEDISIDDLLSGARSGENQRSFQQWLESRPPAT
jgi:hypothetical protein